jgi:hypothetical protein
VIATLVTVALAASCHTVGHGDRVRPDPVCTPGSRVHLTRVQVCTPTPRPTLKTSVRRETLAEYGVPNWTGDDGEIDHEVPWAITHDSSENNLWPQPKPKLKDALENYIINQRLCPRDGKHRLLPATMRVRTARRIFRSNWVAFYDFYVKRHEINASREGTA